MLSRLDEESRSPFIYRKHNKSKGKMGDINLNQIKFVIVIPNEVTDDFRCWSLDEEMVNGRTYRLISNTHTFVKLSSMGVSEGETKEGIPPRRGLLYR